MRAVPRLLYLHLAPLLLVMIGTSPAHAQQLGSFLGRNLYGGGIDVLSRDGTSLPMIGLQLTRTSGHAVLPELDASFIWLVAALGINLNMGVGLAVEDPGRNVMLVVRGGPSVVLGATWYGAVAQPGYHAGAGLLVRTDGETAIRFDVSRQFYGESASDAVWRFGFSITELGRRGPGPAPAVQPSCGCHL